MIQYKSLSIAGFDGSGGAGIQADLKTFSALGCYGMTVLTALPVQNTCGVSQCYDLPLSAIADQLEAIFSDIRPDSIKIGMLANAEIIELVASYLEKNARDIPIVLDPVMMAKSGAPLLQLEAIDVLKQTLIPLCTIITPNLPEACLLLGNTQDQSMSDMAKALLDLGSEYVLLKAGHAKGSQVNDLLVNREQELVLTSERIVTKNTHGTGCTLSAAIAAGLAKGLPMQQVAQVAKNYVFEAIKSAAINSVGQGHGPVHHFYHWW